MPYVADVSGRGPSTATLARRGVIAAAVLVVLTALLLMRYQGAFQPVFPATAMVDDIGDGVRSGADVKLRGALVGTVGDVRVHPNPGGTPVHEVALRLRPEMAASIPVGVTARVVPTNIFGAPSVELLDPAQPASRPRLARGAVIAGDRSAGTLQLQTVLNQLNTVLSSVRPAQLNVALTNISQAIQGRGEKIGSIITRTDHYVTTLNAHTPEFTADLSLLGTDLRILAETSPALLDAVDNAVVSARTVVDERVKLTDTLTGGAATADRTGDFLSDAEDRLVKVADDLNPITRVLADQHKEIARALASVGQGTQTLGKGFLQNSGGLALQMSLTPFSPYTARDCPRYGHLAGPNCDDQVPAPGTPPPSFPFYQGVPDPPPGFGPLSKPMASTPRTQDRGPATHGLPGMLPGMFGGGR
jgi:virulence factor Mce-like protein